jgi:hypothetical protein
MRSTDGGGTWASLLDLAQPSAAGLAPPSGDLILAEASEAGGTQLDRLDDGPAHPAVLYLSVA